MECTNCSSTNVYRVDSERVVCRDCLTVMDIPTTEREEAVAKQKTQHKRIAQTKNRKKSKSFNPIEIGILSIIGFGLVSSGWFWLKRSLNPYVCSRRERKAVVEALAPLREKLTTFDENFEEDFSNINAFNIESTLKKMFLQNEQMLTDFNALEFPVCAQLVEKDYAVIMDAWFIKTSFLLLNKLDENELGFTVEERIMLESLLNIFEKNEKRFQQTFSNMEEGISNNSVTFNMTKEQLETEAIAVTFLGILIRSQQIFQSENQILSSELDPLKLGWDTNYGNTEFSVNYDFEMHTYDGVIFYRITPKVEGLRALSAAVAINSEQTTSEIICVSDKTSRKQLAAPTPKGDEMICAKGSSLAGIYELNLFDEFDLDW